VTGSGAAGGSEAGRGSLQHHDPATLFHGVEGRCQTGEAGTDDHQIGVNLTLQRR
jgi:hypothetical protein